MQVVPADFYDEQVWSLRLAVTGWHACLLRLRFLPPPLPTTILCSGSSSFRGRVSTWPCGLAKSVCRLLLFSLSCPAAPHDALLDRFSLASTEKLLSLLLHGAVFCTDA